MTTTCPTRSAVLAAAAVRLARQARQARQGGTRRPPTSAESALATLPVTQPTRLRLRLVILDVVAAASSWGLAASAFGRSAQGPGIAARVMAVTSLALVTVVVADARRLYRAQVCSIRAIEVQRMGQVALLVAAATAFAGPQLGLRLPIGEVVVGGGLTFALGNTFRAAYRGWLATNRSQGRFQRQVVIVGDATEARDLYELVMEHPQLGLDVVGLIGEPDRLRGWHGTVPHLGPAARAEELVQSSGATGVLIAPRAFSDQDLNSVTRNLLQAGVHVHLSSGLAGFAAQRVRPQLLGHESVLYLEPLGQARWQLAAKRALDLVLATIIGVLSLPILAIAACAIKMDDGGPVIFRQTRVGRGGKHYTILKLRTMVPDAEARYAELAPVLAARSGPLVKLHADPRVTRVGRVLRATSIDELPQILNVLAGSMSLVGPRPNLLLEAEGLDPTFLAHKCQVRPGISGLWQVEARDDPSFSVYRRLDLFYVENWSIGLDLAILLATGQRVIWRALRLLVDHRRRGAGGGGAAVAPSME